MTMTKAERAEYVAIRKQAGLQIDAETAEVEWWWAGVLDPYGIGEAEGYDDGGGVGRIYFARAPGGVWVCFADLPKATIEALRERGKGERAALGLGPPPRRPRGKLKDALP